MVGLTYRTSLSTSSAPSCDDQLPAVLAAHWPETTAASFSVTEAANGWGILDQEVLWHLPVGYRHFSRGHVPGNIYEWWFCPQHSYKPDSKFLTSADLTTTCATGTVSVSSISELTGIPPCIYAQMGRSVGSSTRGQCGNVLLNSILTSTD